MKKSLAIIGLAIVAAFALCLVGCGNQSQSASSTNVGSDKPSDTGSNTDREPLSEKNSQFGKSIELEDFNIEFTEAYLDKPREDGYWWYCDITGISIPKDSWVIAARANITSKANVPFGVSSTAGYTSKAIINGQYEYKVDAVGANGDDTISPMEEKEIIFYVEIPAKMKEQLETADIRWNVSFKTDKNGQLLYDIDQNRNVVILSLVK